MRRSFTVIAIIILLFSATEIIFAKEASKDMIACPEISGIELSTQLSKEEKVKKLLPYLKKEECWGRALYMLKEIDYDEALQVAIKRFEDPKTSKEDKIGIAENLLNRFKYNGIIPHYKDFLVAEIVNNINDFMKNKENPTLSAVGHYAFIASGFWGYDSSLFGQFKDPRVIPNLIKALNAPDEIYGKGGGCERYPVSDWGRSTGRNVARQQIPVALAKLEAKEAILALLKIFKSHHDYYLKNNAAYALGYLLEGKDKEDFRRLIDSSSNPEYQLSFGKGLVEQGDLDGLAYIRLRLKNCQDKWGGALYEIEQKLVIVKHVKDARLKAFYAEALSCGIFRQILSDGKVITEDAMLFTLNDKNHNLERMARAYEDILNGILLNGFLDLVPIVKEIGQQSTLTRIKDITQRFLVEVEKTA